MRCLRILVLFLWLFSPSTQAAEPKYENAFSPKQGATELIIDTIHNAHKSIYVAAYVFTSRPIADALIEAADRGLDVKVVLDAKQSRGKGHLSDYLTNNNVLVHKNGNYAIMHNKFMIIDQKVLELGSFNYTNAAEEKNAENVFILRRAPKVIKSYTEYWNKLWREGSNE